MEKAPVFVQLNEYKKGRDVLELVKNKLHQSEEILNRVKKLKFKEDEELANWVHLLEEVHKRTSALDEALEEPENV